MVSAVMAGLRFSTLFICFIIVVNLQYEFQVYNIVVQYCYDCIPFKNSKMLAV